MLLQAGDHSTVFPFYYASEAAVFAPFRKKGDKILHKKNAWQRDLLGLAVKPLDLARGKHGFNSCRSLARRGASVDTPRKYG